MIKLTYVGRQPLTCSQVTPVFGGDTLLQAMKNRLSDNEVACIKSVVLTNCTLYVSQDKDAVPPRRGRGGSMVGKAIPIVTFLSPRLPLHECDKKAFVDHVNEKKFVLMLPEKNLTTNVTAWIVREFVENFFASSNLFHVDISPAVGVVAPRIGSIVQAGKRLNVICPRCLHHAGFPTGQESITRRNCRRCGLTFLAGLEKSIILGENIEALANLLPPSEKSKRIARQMFMA